MKTFWQEHWQDIKQLLNRERKSFIVGLLIMFGVGYAIGEWIMAFLTVGIYVFGIFLIPFGSWKDAFYDD